MPSSTQIFLALGLLASISWSDAQASDESVPQHDLAKLLALALERNPALAVSQANVSASEGRLRGTKEYPNPELAVAAGRGRALSGLSTRGTEESIRVLQPLEWVPKRAAKIRAANEAMEVSTAQHNDTILRVTAAVTTAYYQLLGAQRESALASQTLTAVRRSAEIARKRVEAGEAAKFEQVRAEVELQRATNEADRARSRVAEGRAALDAEAGGAVGRQFEVVGEFPEGNADWTLALVMQTIDQHPLIRVREHEEAERREQLVSARASRVPDVGLFGTFDRDIDRESYHAGLSIPIPLWSQRQGAIAEAAAGARRAEAQLQQSRLELRKGIVQAYEQYRVAYRQLELFRKGLLRQSEEAVEIARKSYRFGEVSLLELFDAQRVAFQVIREFYQAQVNLALAITALERLTGGLP